MEVESAGHGHVFELSFLRYSDNLGWLQLLLFHHCDEIGLTWGGDTQLAIVTCCYFRVWGDFGDW